MSQQQGTATIPSLGEQREFGNQGFQSSGAGPPVGLVGRGWGYSHAGPTEKQKTLGFSVLFKSISQYLQSANPEGSRLVVSFPNNSLWSTPYLFPKVWIPCANFWQQAQARPFHQVCLTIYKFKRKLQWKGRHLFLVTYTKNNCLASSLRTESRLRDGSQGADLSAEEQAHPP